MNGPAEPMLETLTAPPNIVRYYMNKHRALALQFMKFGTVGGVCFLVDCALVHFFNRYTHIGPYWSGLASFPITATLVWLGNRTYTFRGQHSGSLHSQWMRFIVSCSIGLAVNRGTYALLLATIPFLYRHPTLALAGGTGAGMFFNFFAAKRLVFK